MTKYGNMILEATIEEAKRLSDLAVKAANQGNLEEVLIQIGKMTAVLEKGRDTLSRVSLSRQDVEKLRNTVWLEVTARKQVMEALGDEFRTSLTKR